MKPLLLFAFASLALAGCEQVLTKTAEYRPEKAGTVDHALCLLGYTAVPLRELMTGHHLVDVRLNGRAGRFVVDTGANATVLHAPLASEYGLGRGAGPAGAAIGLGGTMQAAQVPIESLSIGPVPIRKRRIMTADLSQLERVLTPISGGRVSGIIGQDVMREHRAVVDVARSLLYLIEADQDPAPVPAESCRADDTTTKEGSAPKSTS